MWRVFITPSAERIAKKLSRDVEGFVFAKFPDLIRNNPVAGGELSGPFAWLRSFHFSVDGQPYRIAYEMNTKKKIITVHYVGHRSNFYERLKRLLQK